MANKSIDICGSKVCRDYFQVGNLMQEISELLRGVYRRMVSNQQGVA